ncbi:MAG TPA: hypothetical protein VHU89_08270 [Acidobacteriaceae bacterium]|jgi:hypothetical protein|nr:hypothetical protein [Acidobacteriaceae bacterium]
MLEFLSFVLTVFQGVALVCLGGLRLSSDYDLRSSETEGDWLQLTEYPDSYTKHLRRGVWDGD